MASRQSFSDTHQSMLLQYAPLKIAPIEIIPVESVDSVLEKVKKADTDYRGAKSMTEEDWIFQEGLFI